MKTQHVWYGLCLALGIGLGSAAFLPMQAFSAEKTAQKEPLMIQEQGSFMAG